MIKYKKEFKGHSVYVNGEFYLWVYGSKKNAEQELRKILKDTVR